MEVLLLSPHVLKIMSIIKSKYTVPVLSMISILLCFFPILNTKITTGEAYTSVIRVYNLLEFGAFGIVVLIAPLLVSVITSGCQSEAAKEIFLELLLLGNSICYTHSVHNAWNWLAEISDSVIRIKATVVLYPVVFVFLCLAAIIKIRKPESNKQI